MAEQDNLEFEWIEQFRPQASGYESQEMRDIWSEVDKKESSLLDRIKRRSLGRIAVKLHI